MANTKGKTISKAPKADSPADKEIEILSETIAEEKPRYRVKKDLDPNTVVTVRNGFQGVLVYESRKTREVFKWAGFGDEQDMDLQELKNAKNSAKDFFINNWFLIDDPEVLEYLGVTQYYKYALRFNDFDNLFSKTPEEIMEIIPRLSRGQQKSVAYRAKQMIADGEIDSIKVITAIEKCLDIDLIEK